MRPIKLIIQKKFDISSNFKRFRTVERITIDDSVFIKTEAQLCDYIYSRHGEGRYMCLAYQKGYEGFWCYWIGWLYSNGFIRDIRRNKELALLKDELKNAQSYEEREMIEEDLDWEKRMQEQERKIRRQSPVGLKKLRAGILHGYDENPEF